MNEKPQWIFFLMVLCLALFGCDDPSIDVTTTPVSFEAPCAAVEAGSCTWAGDSCDFSGLDLGFCGSGSAPASCYPGPEEIVPGVAVTVPRQLGQGVEVTCVLVDGGDPQDPPNATVCIYPLNDETCQTPWHFRSSEWNQDREMTIDFLSSGGARIAVVDVDGSLCNSLTISCTAD